MRHAQLSIVSELLQLDVLVILAISREDGSVANVLT